jgi:hypothetical protein
MDPLSLAAIVAAVTGSAAGEAGKSAWAALVSLVKRRFGDESAVTGAVTSADGDSENASAVADALTAAAAADAGFEAELARWRAEAISIVQGAGSVTNVIAGQAQVDKAVQAHTITGTINL